MNRWNLLGWLVVLAVGSLLLTPLLRFGHRYWMHRKTRNTPPREGQIWFDAVSNRRVFIRHVSENGIIHCEQSAGMSSIGWGDTAERWDNRVHNWMMFLILENEYARRREEEKK